MTSSALILQAIVLTLVFLLSQSILSYLRSPLKSLPGPWLAKFSDIWRLVNHYRQTHIETQQALHAKYGEYVRIGPNTVSIADASLVKTIYNTRGTYLKSEYYSINDALSNGQTIQNIFSTRSNAFHARSIKPVQKMYSLQSAMKLERVMDEDMRVLCLELESRFIGQGDGMGDDDMCEERMGEVCDIGKWISYFAWDFLGHVTWSERIGFMVRGEDVGGMIGTAERVMRYFSVVGQIPFLDKLFGKNPYLPSSIYKFDDFSAAAGIATEQFMKRMQEGEQGELKQDFLNGFLQAKKEHPDLVSDNEVIGYMIISILGGADTLAIIMKATIYHILTSTSACSRLVTELRSNNLTHPAPYAQLEKLPYLTACIQEGLRMHPVVGHILERIVPATGLPLPNNTFLPPGTIVGMNPWVIHYRSSIFGLEPEKFRPERWLRSHSESQSNYEARLRKMKDADLSFGGGNRVCLGKPLGLVEVHKVVAMVFGKFDLQKEGGWRLNRQWFVWPHGVRVRMTMAVD